MLNKSPREEQRARRNLWAKLIIDVPYRMNQHLSTTESKVEIDVLRYAISFFLKVMGGEERGETLITTLKYLIITNQKVMVPISEILDDLEKSLKDASLEERRYVVSEILRIVTVKLISRCPRPYPFT